MYCAGNLMRSLQVAFELIWGMIASLQWVWLGVQSFVSKCSIVIQLGREDGLGPLLWEGIVALVFLSGFLLLAR